MEDKNKDKGLKERLRALAEEPMIAEDLTEEEIEKLKKEGRI